MEPVTQAQLYAIYRRALADDALPSRAHVPPEALQALVEGVGTDEERLQTLDHVMACRTCREGFDLLRTLREAHEDSADEITPVITRAIEPVRTRDVVTRTDGRGWMPMLLAASLLVAVGVTAVRLREPTPIADDTLRGSSATPAALQPRGEVSAEAARRYVWRSVPGAVRYDFELLDAAGAMVHSASTRDTTYELALSLALSPRTPYQWLVSAQLDGASRVVGTAERFTVR